MNHYEKIKEAIDQVKSIQCPKEDIVFIVSEIDLEKLKKAIPDFEIKYSKYFIGNAYVPEGTQPIPHRTIKLSSGYSVA